MGNNKEEEEIIRYDISIPDGYTIDKYRTNFEKGELVFLKKPQHIIIGRIIEIIFFMLLLPIQILTFLPMLGVVTLLLFLDGLLTYIITGEITATVLTSNRIFNILCWISPIMNRTDTLWEKINKF